MDVRTFIVELVKAAAWPLVTLTIVVMLRKPVLRLIEGLKLTKVKGGGLEAEFARVGEDVAIAKVEAEVAALPPAPVDDATLLTKRVESALLLGRGAARGRVVDAWVGVEKVVAEAAQKVGISAPSFRAQVEALQQRGLLLPATVDALNGLGKLRNLAVHGREPVSTEKAEEFVVMTEAVKFALEMNLKRTGGS